jgi:alkanesulfonate monooxygenase SsuD/methylene tetrahydromethanopterin reductase-like flavin-dependent oxidoreductase (luciferase family)
MTAAARRTLSFHLHARLSEASGPGLPGTIELFQLAEALGFDHGWLEPADEDPSAVSALTLLAAISQRTRRVGLGVTVPSAGGEGTATLASALTTLDVLAGGRMRAGFSGPDPARAGVVQVHQQLAARGPADGEAAPHERVWFAATDVASARWAARQGLNLLVASARHDHGDGDVEAQHGLLRAYREVTGATHRTAVTRVLLPFDSADRSTRTGYAARAGSGGAQAAAQAEQPVGVAVAGSSCEIARRLLADVAVAEADELVVLLPPDLTIADRAQILHDIATYVAPELGLGAPADLGSCDDGDDRPVPSADAAEPVPAGRAA